MMIRWVGVIRGCVGANGCIFWQKKRPALAFNLELGVKFGLKVWTNILIVTKCGDQRSTCIRELRLGKSKDGSTGGEETGKRKTVNSRLEKRTLKRWEHQRRRRLPPRRMPDHPLNGNLEPTGPFKHVIRAKQIKNEKERNLMLNTVQLRVKLDRKIMGSRKRDFSMTIYYIVYSLLCTKYNILYTV